MKIVTVLVVAMLAAFGGAALMKRLRAGGSLPVEGFEEVALTPVPPIQEAP